MKLAPSDWLVDPVETGIQVAPTEGWTATAPEQTAALSGPRTAALVMSIKQWQAARRTQTSTRLRIRVRHQDTLPRKGQPTSGRQRKRTRQRRDTTPSSALICCVKRFRGANQ